MTMRQKRLLRHLLLLAALIAVVVIVVTTAKRDKTEDSSAGTGAAASAVTDHDAQYDALTYTNGSATLSFTLEENGEWVWADLPEFPLDDATVLSILDQITGLQPQQTITAPETMETYGLDDPSMTLTAGSGGKTTLTVKLGKQVTGDSGSYYLQLNDDDSTVYIVSGDLAEALNRPIYGMMELPELPQAAPEDFRAVTLTRGETSESCIAYPGAEESVPLVWRMAGVDVSGSTVLQGVLEELGSLSLESCVDYAPSAGAASICGFDAPAAVAEAKYLDDSGTEQSLKLTVGGTVLSAESRYVRLGDDPVIYAIAVQQLTAILAAAETGLTS